MYKFLFGIVVYSVISAGSAKAQDYYPSAYDIQNSINQTIRVMAGEYGGSNYSNPSFQGYVSPTYRAEQYFKARQTNRYYLELEKLQKRELQRMRNDGSLTIENLNYLFNR